MEKHVGSHVATSSSLSPTHKLATRAHNFTKATNKATNNTTPPPPQQQHTGTSTNMVLLQRLQGSNFLRSRSRINEAEDKKVGNTRRSSNDEKRKQGRGRKQRSLIDRDVFEGMGVFISTRNGMSPPTSGRFGNSQSTSTSSIMSWKSSGSKEHHKNAPLIVRDPEASREFTNELEALGRVMARSKELPSTWYYQSNHIMVNQERVKRTIAPIMRMRELDLLAQAHAEEMAKENSLFHMVPEALAAGFQRPSRRLGANVAVGKSIKEMHTTMMTTPSQKNNILDRRYTHMGMATAVGSNGELYMCQIFRG
jgi:Cysteine-rich secretory protein family